MGGGSSLGLGHPGPWYRVLVVYESGLCRQLALTPVAVIGDRPGE